MPFPPSSFPRRAFTLVEAILSIAILLLISAITSGLYGTSVSMARQRSEESAIRRLMTNQMELLLATRYAALANGSQSVSVNGRSETLAWSLSPVDLDSDAINETGVVRCEVTLAQRTLSTLIFNGTAEVGKL